MGPPRGGAGAPLGAAPTLVSGTTYRYSFTGSFVPGEVMVNFTADGWRAAATHPDLTMRDRATTALRP